MKFSEGSILRQYERAFRAYGIEISFEDEALLLIAERRGTGKNGRARLAHRLGEIVPRLQISSSGLRPVAAARDRQNWSVNRESARTFDGGRSPSRKKPRYAHEAALFADQFSGNTQWNCDSMTRRLVAWPSAPKPSG